MAEAPKTGLLDLEKELTCSICTEVLYQPLTLLDCLHTFCGSCLKEWFSSVASHADTLNPHPFTCPSCRATVRETRPDAKVTTLLDMFLQANPSKGRTIEEMEELKKRYKVGEQVMPKIRPRYESSADREDREWMEEVQQLSLREVGVRASESYDRGSSNRNRDGSRDAREEDARQQRRREHDRRRRPDRHDTSTMRNNGSSSAIDSRSQARQIEHQSSLRSLLSSSDIDSSEMEEEILRQIMDEGLLDGIDLNNIDVSQEDELSERIADAYRRRHGGDLRSRNVQAQETRSTNTHAPITSDQAQPQRHHHRRTSSAADQVSRPSHPPISRPHLLEAYPAPQGHRRRTSSEHRRQTSPAAGSSATRVSPDTPREAARSATDLSTRTQASTVTHPRPVDLPFQGRRNTDLESRRPRAKSRDRTPQGVQPMSPRSTVRPSHEVLNRAAGSQTATPMSATAPVSGAIPCPTTTGEAGHERTPGPRDIPNAASRSVSSPTRSRAPPVLYPEPSIRCNRCGKSNIEYELHQHCSICHGGNYNLCLRCYHLGRGCLHWYGFGLAASQHYMRLASSAGYPQNHPLPHQFTGHRYLRPTSAISQHPTPENRNPSRMTPEDPTKRLQTGMFCSNCSAFANECFWKCDLCNEGEWRFCNPCINQGKCCTHPLLPVAYVSSTDARAQGPSSARSTPLNTPKIHPPHFHPSGPTSRDNPQYIPLAFSPPCQICTYPIQPSTTRFHCPQCSNGDYDICTPCYLKLVATGKISKANGDKGWRRCLEGHRMIVVGFEDSALGQRRVVVRDLVGGYVFKDTPAQTSTGRTPTTAEASANTPSLLPNTTTTTNNLLPDGGVGIRFFAVWSYWPQEGNKDELAFPRGAEITEAEEVDEEWFVGCYAGAEGLFPGSYVKFLGRSGGV